MCTLIGKMDFKTREKQLHAMGRNQKTALRPHSAPYTSSDSLGVTPPLRTQFHYVKTERPQHPT